MSDTLTTLRAEVVRLRDEAMAEYERQSLDDTRGLTMWGSYFDAYTEVLDLIDKQREQ